MPQDRCYFLGLSEEEPEVQDGQTTCVTSPRENMEGQGTYVQHCLAAKPAPGRVLKNTDFPLDPHPVGTRP